MAVCVFVLTVMLGLGGTAASALWQQSAKATMTVTAAATWPAPAFSGFVCSNDSNKTTATLRATGTRAPASLTYSALQTNGTYGPSYTDSVTLGTVSSVALTMTSPMIVANRSTSQLTIRVTATYSDQTETTATAVVQLEQGNNSNKVTCISPLA
ncbi:hypothetical protein LFT45_17220 [Arthrobacter sp. FW305-BF8]|uniref:hypothetical protein n=1 Tax=Arthrobacter sp. FW305-BF8 TaxID=2879617 RepID=UPI001F4864FC|nr:hypothetical protein [Arthrobacter sp. FW305-BF8]UKA53447.1 hypothetical protein LFT45_17220 [Arthrobacter sp. FW305-BF8]